MTLFVFRSAATIQSAWLFKNNVLDAIIRYEVSCEGLVYVDDIRVAWGRSEGIELKGISE